MEQERSDYLGNFDAKNSNAYKTVSEHCQCFEFAMLHDFVTMVLLEEEAHGNAIKLPPVADSDIDCLFKFIDDNLDLFMAYFKAGSTIRQD